VSSQAGKSILLAARSAGVQVWSRIKISRQHCSSRS
jgi:hypothetical protein